MLPYIIGGAVVYAVSKLLEENEPKSSCRSSERDVEYYRNHARKANSQVQEQKSELEWRHVKEKQTKIKRYINKLKEKKSFCRRGSTKYVNLENEINKAILKREKLQAKADRLKPRRE